MPPRRKTPPADTTSTGTTRRRRAVTAGALLPVVLGVASTLLPSGKGGVTPAPTQPAAVQETATPQKGSFTPACTLPFPEVRNPAADDHCGIAGDGKDEADQEEAIAKNNFCAPAAHPQDITYQELMDLQTKSQTDDNPSGKPIGKKLDDRKDIENMGEGNYVSYVALIMDAHYSDTSGGEKVNCNKSGNPPNDIHIVLVSKEGETDECTSTTAEMSPHYRPTGWTPSVLNALKKPVRIRGQLFYDNSHAICGKTKPNPKRASLWEVHPVYSIDVCKSENLDDCRKNIDNDSQWTPIT